ncbi:unnamed protein product [Urochloa humidicola]
MGGDLSRRAARAGSARPRRQRHRGVRTRPGRSGGSDGGARREWPQRQRRGGRRLPFLLARHSLCSAYSSPPPPPSQFPQPACTDQGPSWWLQRTDAGTGP